MADLVLQPVGKTQSLEISSPELPDETFHCTVPEAIGSTDAALWPGMGGHPLEIEWAEVEPGVFRHRWEQKGALGYAVTARAREDQVLIEVQIKNLSAKPWPASLSFACFQPGRAPSFTDYEGTRTLLLVDGEWTPITKLPRQDSERPTVQLWYVKDGARDLPFVDKYKATSRVLPAGVLALQSYDRKHVLAVTADHPLFLFGNLEFGCLHCCPNLGALAPGESGSATHRILIAANTTPDQLRTRM